MSLPSTSDLLKHPLRYRISNAFKNLMVYALLLLLCSFILLPLGWMFTTALRPDHTPIFIIPPEFFPTEHWHWENFTLALTNRSLPFFTFTLNTLKIFAFNVVGSVISCTMCAFAFSRMKFRGSKFLFSFLLITMLIPFAVLMIPTFIMFNKIGWYGTILPLIVPAFFGNAFFIFLITQYMKTIPKDLDEAAIIDGAGYFQVYWRVILPLCMPVVAVQVVFLFLSTWGDLLGPLIYLTNTSQFTVAIGLASFASRQNPNNNLLMAANLIMMIPPLILFFFAQEKLIGGIASVGLKG